jgi:hypothetical protein
MGVLGAEPVAGEGGLAVEFVGDLVALGHRQLVRAGRGKGILGVDVQAGDTVFGG